MEPKKSTWRRKSHVFIPSISNIGARKFSVKRAPGGNVRTHLQARILIHDSRWSLKCDCRRRVPFAPGVRLIH
jgi:hypothetical protein